MKLKTFLSNLLSMSKTERNGTIVLIFLLLLFIIARFILPPIFTNNENYLKEIEAQIEVLEQNKDSVILKSQNQFLYTPSKKEIVASKKNIKPEITSSIQAKINYFTFDPNNVSYNELLKLGVSVKCAGTFIKYREKGGRFHYEKDLLKIYGIDSSLYTKLAPYITIEKDTLNKSRFATSTAIQPKRNDVIVNVNSADSLSWLKLKGVGPVYAKRICKFRESLGGFVEIDQIKEVYNFPEETFLSIRNQLIMDTISVTKINLNFAEINDLKKHPYCSYSTARLIIDYRSLNGKFTEVNQLLADSIVPFDIYKKLSPYLCVK